MAKEGVKPLNLDDVVGKVKNRVALVGVELEGGWVDLPPGVSHVERDGSVFNDRLPAGVRHMGELAVGPALPAGIAELIRIHHPPKVNHTCGMHVHMSFDTLWYYHLLMVPEYQETILHYLTLWAKNNKFSEKHHIWGRLAGESRYCQKQFWPDAQSTEKRKLHDQNAYQNAYGHRYTVIHYCGRQGTIECRVLPMMTDVKKAISAVHTVIDVTNACIHILGKKYKRDKETSRIELPGNMIYEETVVEQI
jgi:hypothetical protein